MQPKHFIDVLIDTYEDAYTVFKAGLISEELEALVLQTAVRAADQVATNNWHGSADRAGAIAGALLRSLYPSTASDEAAALSPAVRLHLADASDPDVRAPPSPPPPPPGG